MNSTRNSVRCASSLAAAVAALSLAWPASGGAQQYRARIDVHAQSVSLRGLQQDSIAAALAVQGPGGGLESPDGHAVRCSGPTCYFWRPGATLRGVPLTTSASVVVWGLGVEGLSLRGTGRLMADLGDDLQWPGTEPSGQLIEGYLEYERTSLTARGGRQLVMSRLEPIGFDGGWVRYRAERASLEFTGYGGWGLGQATAVSALSPALNPLDEWRPRDRQLVAGAEAAWSFRDLDARAEYRREVDQQNRYFVSERTALSLGASFAGLRATGGLDYNIAEGHLGNVDLGLSHMRPGYTVSVGARRYRPYFSLWTLWGAFSPVPYHAVNASVQARPLGWLTLHARGERYRYDDAEISTALVPQLEDQGWRANTGATATLNERWTLAGTYGLEYGPGAAGRFADGVVSYAPNSTFAFDLYGGTMARPLELRYYDATSRWIGGRVEWSVSTQRRVWIDGAFVEDDRNRPDASANSFSQVRIRSGLSVAFGARPDRWQLPPARRSLR
jgi:hypothetical protein